jgi:hypothetical protein
MTLQEYYQHILKNVAFDKQLFKKELIKAKKALRTNEIIGFKNWCLITFSIHLQPIILEVFDKWKR